MNLITAESTLGMRTRVTPRVLPCREQNCTHKHMGFFKTRSLETTQHSSGDEWIKCGLPMQWGATQS